MIRVAALAALLPQAVAAQCVYPAEPFLACTMQGGTKELSVCVEGRTVRYAFGPVGGKPELVLPRDVTEVDYTPWPGAGRTIWEEVRFENLGYTYLVHGWVDRVPEEESPGDPIRPMGGGVVVMRGDETLAEIACDAESADFIWTDAISHAMAEAGRCLDQYDRVWRDCE